MKRQKIKRYRFSVTQNTRRKKSPEPLKSAGVVLVCLCLLAGAAFGGYKMIRSKAVGWQGEGLHRYFVSPATGTRVQGLYEINHSLYYFGSNHFLKIGWIEEDGYIGYADEDGKSPGVKPRWTENTTTFSQRPDNCIPAGSHWMVWSTALTKRDTRAPEPIKRMARLGSLILTAG